MMDEANTEGGEVLTGAELFHYLTNRNEEQVLECRNKIKEYIKLRDILQNITDRCRVPVLAPVAGGMAYFESTIDYTNNILVLLGDSWFAERSAKQAREIASRRLEFLQAEEVALVAEAKALMERQSLFLAEVPNAEQAMAEVEAVKANAIHSRKEKQGEKIEKISSQTAALPLPSSSSCTDAAINTTSMPLRKEEMPLLTGLENEELAVIDELDQLTEEELIQIEEELGDKIEDDELVERIMTERLIAKKEKRVQEELRKRQAGAPQLSTNTTTTTTSTNNNTTEGIFGTPGDIGRIAVSVVSDVVKTSSNEENTVSSSKRRVKFSDVVEFVPPEETTAAVKRPVTITGKSYCTTHILGEVMEHDVVKGSSCLDSSCATSTGATGGSVNVSTAVKKKKSIFRSELDKDEA
ncbi:Prefoldin alpha-like [Trypanosoma melophagium]|uniref:Prefoldin alpha-like n=1 Tax=Trypanosoma melophagium TaxID=715481 RepID=UPI00351A11D2|nr:Prefoldin alpha-like [Trypanosoma melophagium]